MLMLIEGWYNVKMSFHTHLNSPFFEVVDREGHAATAIQRRGDVDSIEPLRLPHILDSAQEVTQHLAGQHLLHVHVLDVELGLVGQRELWAVEGERVRELRRVQHCDTETVSIYPSI